MSDASMLVDSGRPTEQRGAGPGVSRDDGGGDRSCSVCPLPQLGQLERTGADGQDQVVVADHRRDPPSVIENGRPASDSDVLNRCASVSAAATDDRRQIDSGGRKVRNRQHQLVVRDADRRGTGQRDRHPRDVESGGRRRARRRVRHYSVRSGLPRAAARESSGINARTFADRAVRLAAFAGRAHRAAAGRPGPG